MQIKIDVNLEKRAITGLDIPDKINPVELAMIFNQMALRTLAGVKLEPASKIIKPKLKVVNPGGK